MDSPEKIIIKNGKIITERASFFADILIEGEKISKIDASINEDFAKIIDASGKYIFPGGIDVHTHLELDTGQSESVDDFFSGTIASVCGGTTTIIDHIAFGPKDCNLRHQLDKYHKKAAGKAVIDYSFHGVVQHINEAILDEIDAVAKSGITSLKAYMTYDFKLSDEEILQLLKKTEKLGVIMAFHAEDHQKIEALKAAYLAEGKLTPEFHAKSRPDYCEAEAVKRLIKLAAIANDAPIYIVHLSSKKALEIAKEAISKGQKNIILETCPQYLTLTEEAYLREDGLKYIMSPPLRKKEDVDALWKALNDDIIKVIATDHCPFNYNKEKQFGKDDFTKCPNGAPGIEERFSLIYSEGVSKNRININKFVELISVNPAKIFGLYPQKGAILSNSDADLVIFDPSQKNILKQENLHSKADYSPYEDIEVTGKIEMVIQRGRLLVKDGAFLGQKGDGKFLARNYGNYEV